MCVSVELFSLTGLLSLNAVKVVGIFLVGLLFRKNCLKFPFGENSTTTYSGPEGEKEQYQFSFVKMHSFKKKKKKHF